MKQTGTLQGTFPEHYSRQDTHARTHHRICNLTTWVNATTKVSMTKDAKMSN